MVHPSSQHNIYVYKLTTDNGGAPCAESGLLSLALCMPTLRSTAKVGDWVFGVGSYALDNNGAIIYVAQVTDKLVNGEYYRTFPYRRDASYRWYAGGLHLNPNAIYHVEDESESDLGEGPTYPRANVLLSSNFRYFGRHAVTDYYDTDREFRGLIESLGIGHRVNHGIDRALKSIQEELWMEYPNKLVLGQPTDSSLLCH